MLKYIFINGKLVIESKAEISINDRGFLFGDGLFETLKSYNGFLFMLDAHLQRLFHSLKILKYNLTFNEQYIKEALKKTIDKNGLGGKDAYIKIIVTRGIHRGDLYFSGKYISNLIIIAKKLISCPEDDYKRGIKIISSIIRRPSMGSPVYSHKLLNYFENLYAKDEAYHNGAKEALFLTRDYLVLEGASSNIFYVKRNTVYTPPLTQNILPGITRKVVMEICRENGIKIRERRIHYREFITAHEIFKTSSIAGVVPIRKVDRFELDGRVPGNITTKLMELYESKIDYSNRAVYK